MAKETKTEAQKRVFDTYKSKYNPVPDFLPFLETVGEKDKKVFTAQTYKNYFYKNLEGSKDLIKYYKDGKVKPDQIVIDSLTVFGNEIRGQLYGDRKQNSTLFEYPSGWRIKLGKKLVNKKLGLGLITDFSTTNGPWSYPFMISNEYGNHVRHSGAYLNQFTETAKLRKTYSLED